MQIDLTRYKLLQLSLRHNYFSNSFLEFYSYEGFLSSDIRKNEVKSFCIGNGGWHETLYSLHLISRCEMLHFVTSYIYILWCLTSNKTKAVNKLSRVHRMDYSGRLVGLWLCLSLRCLPMMEYVAPWCARGDGGSCSLYNSSHTNHTEIRAQRINCWFPSEGFVSITFKSSEVFLLVKTGYNKIPFLDYLLGLFMISWTGHVRYISSNWLNLIHKVISYQSIILCT